MVLLTLSLVQLRPGVQVLVTEACEVAAVEKLVENFALNLSRN